jgi:hypothetical protein
LPQLERITEHGEKQGNQGKGFHWDLLCNLFEYESLILAVLAGSFGYFPNAIGIVQRA